MRAPYTKFIYNYKLHLENNQILECYANENTRAPATKITKTTKSLNIVLMKISDPPIQISIIFEDFVVFVVAEFVNFVDFGVFVAAVDSGHK